MLLQKIALGLIMVGIGICGYTLSANSKFLNVRTAVREGIQPVYVDNAKYRIAILDSGFDPSRATAKLKLCKTGHWDYLTHTPNINYTDVHGTEVASIIADKLKDVDYCVIIYQIFNTGTRHVGLDAFIDALKKAKDEKLNAINMSFAGYENSDEELKLLNLVYKSGAAIFVAAGNNGKNLDKVCDVFPACYSVKSLIVVGALDFENPKNKAQTTNYGKKVNIYAPGYYVTNTGDLQFGTSYASPRALSSYIEYLDAHNLLSKKIKQ